MSQPIRIASYNLRFDIWPDGVTVKQSLERLPPPLKKPEFYKEVARERPWSERRVRVWRQLESENLDVIGFQEAVVRQCHDLQELLGSEWAWVGVGRDDGQNRGEFNPIFYRQSRYNLVHKETFWLSTTPSKPSRYPGAGSFRLCTLVRLTSKTTGQTVSVLNSHLDDQSDKQRQYGASMLLTRARYEEYAQNAAVVLTGDFNSPPDGSDSGAYQIITGARAPLDIDHGFAKQYAVPSNAPPFKMLDIRGETPTDRIEGHFATYTGFVEVGRSDNYRRIDFILGGSNRRWTPLLYKVCETVSDDGVYASDHRPVIAHLQV
ncbi:DNase I-like protein [Exidia glandulosa HHB12029]|uniref:DNase I-like protein n=1 Tax=Exidia glandulosa HHB12029 TaxID=1314781 RepID=A0A165HB37_EXIGL|nr:DNase I-like protein [Exidia glandulosa HHB12029]